MTVAVIPAYNEEKTIGKIIKETKKHVDKVIVVDDGSADSTPKIAKRLGVVLLKHKTNEGLGSSLRDGFKKALRMGADIIITLDADGQHDPKEIPKFVKKIRKGYDFVLGQRNLRKYPFVKKFGNFFLNLMTNFISGTYIKDTESGFRAFRSSALKRLYLRAKQYEIAVEIVFEVGRNKLKYANVPVSSPIYKQGVDVLDGFRNLSYLLHRRRRDLRSYVDDFKFVLRNWLGRV
jgi:glycosyltransferase involved in cell wall biosynthesis